MNKGFRKMCFLMYQRFSNHLTNKKFRKTSLKGRIPGEKKFLLKQVYYL
jgi:hypothetical protein